MYIKIGSSFYLKDHNQVWVKKHIDLTRWSMNNLGGSYYSPCLRNKKLIFAA